MIRKTIQRTLWLALLAVVGLNGLQAQSLFNINSGTATITEFDFNTGVVLSTIPTPVPTDVPALGGSEGLAHGAGIHFFTSGNASKHGEPPETNRTIFFLDPATGAVIDQMVMHAVSGGDLDQAIDALAYGVYGGVRTVFANRPSQDEIYLIDIDTKTHYGTLSLAFHGVGGMGFSAYRQTLYISDSSTDTVREIDPATGTELNSFSVAPDGGVLGVDFVENKLFLAPNHSADIIEVSPVTGMELNRYPAPTIYPSALAGTPGEVTEDPDCDADLLFVVNSSESTYSILDPDTGVELARFLTPIPTYPPGGPPGGGPEGLAFDGNELYYISGDDPDPVRSATIYQIEPCTGSVGGALTPPFPATIGDPTVDALAYGEYGGTPTIFALRPDGNQIFSIDPSSGALTGTITVGGNAIGGLGFSGSTQTLFVSDFNASPNVLHEVDPATGAILGTFTMPSPYLLGVDFVGLRLFGALDDGTGTIHEFDLAGAILNTFPSPDAIPSALAGPPAISTTGSVSIVVTPHNDPIEIGAGGGSFSYDITVTNTTSTTQAVDVWAEITGGGVNILKGPTSLTLGAGVSRSKTYTQSVPGRAAAGTYTLTGYLGTYPTATDSDSFSFTKAGSSARRSRIASMGTASDAWTASLATIHQTSDIPEELTLQQNYPNPFNPTTLIAYTLPEGGHATLAVYDLLGREVARLVDGFQASGAHQVRFDAAHLSAGTYLYVLEAEGLKVVRRMVLLK